jgi:restriction system protein
MEPLSRELTEWLDEILAEDPPYSAPDDDEDDNYDDDEPSSFDGAGQRIIWSFPSDAAYAEYLAVAESRPEEEVRRIIQRLLIPAGATGGDHLIFEIYVQNLNKEWDSEEERLRWQRWADADHVQRVVRYYGRQSQNPPWEGMNWIMNLLPDHPHLAINAIEAYSVAKIGAMTDSMIHGLSDAEGVIRARYIGLPESSGGRLQALLGISSREFEQLIEHLYDRLGYHTELTPSIIDGGRDVIATLSSPGKRERVLVECKRYSNTVSVGLVRQLLGVVSDEKANKGVLVSTANFSRAAKKMAASNSLIELIAGPELVALLNGYLGWTWPARIEHYTRSGPLRLREPAHTSGN